MILQPYNWEDTHTAELVLKVLFCLQAPHQDYRTLEAKNYPIKENDTEQHSAAEGADLSVGAETNAASASKQHQQLPPAVASAGRHAQQEPIASPAQEESSLWYTEEGSSAAGQSAPSEAEQKAGADAPAAVTPGPSQERAPVAESSQADEPSGAGTAALPEATTGAEVLEGIGPERIRNAAGKAASSQTEEASKAGAAEALELSRGAQASFPGAPMAELAQEAAGDKGTTEVTKLALAR